MSYILDALKRAERERKLGQVSVLDEVQSTAAPTRTVARARPWLWLGLGAVLSGLAVYALTGGRHRAPVSATSTPAATVPAPAPAPPVQTAAAPAVALAAPIATPAPAPGPVAAPAPTPQEPDLAARRAGQISRRLAVPGGAALPPAAPVPAPPAPRAATIEDGSGIASVEDLAAPAPPPDARAAAAARPAPPPAAFEEAAAPPQSPTDAAAATPQFKEMPDNYRAQFPQISLDVLAYNEDPARRFVLIDNKHYKEGDTLPQGPRIVAILAQGVVFDWQGKRVLYAGSH